MQKMNCWEAKNCGRQTGGINVHELGVCPASTDMSGNGLNGGKNGGRICWAVAGTFCGGLVQGTFAKKEIVCMTCDFFQRVKEEEGAISFQFLKPGQAYSPSHR